ncbi:MAG: alkaline phosphatase family protein [Anaerolineales bacterium]
MSKRIIIIGLDGASPNLINNWQNDLPNLSGLIDNGTSGILESVIPPRSIPAWYCFATGMNPAKIGVFGFSQRIPNTYDYTFANLSFSRASPFWKSINEQGMETILLHIPGTFPPHPVDGCLVSGWPAPSNLGNLTYTYPPDLSREIDRYVGDPFEFLSSFPIRQDNEPQALQDRLRILRMHADVAYWLLSHRSWDLAVVVLSGLDRASHQFWRHIDANHPAHDPGADQQMMDALLSVYKECDNQVGRFLDLLDDQDTVFIISDHGFGPANRTFFLNNWLMQEGYLTLKPNAELERITWRTKMFGTLAKPLFWFNKHSQIFRTFSKPLKQTRLSKYVRNEYVRLDKSGLVRINHLPVDWEKTLAYCPDEASLYLNLKGRDPMGFVDPGTEANKVQLDIIDRLKRVIDPETNKSIKLKIYPKSDLYRGPFIQDAPDLILEMDDFSTEVMAELSNTSLFIPNIDRSGTHTLEGIFIASGPGIRNIKDFRASLMDIAPTVVHMMGGIIPIESDGRVLLDIFNDKSEVHQRDIQKQKIGLSEMAVSTVLNPEEQEQVEKQLQDLGYMG